MQEQLQNCLNPNSNYLIDETSLFFFQAEDGIRDVAVTGVQTCALPIYLVLAADLIHIEDGQAVARGRLAEDLVALLALAQVAGAGVDADHQVGRGVGRSEEHTSELQSRLHFVCRPLLETKNAMTFAQLM